MTIAFIFLLGFALFLVSVSIGVSWPLITILSFIGSYCFVKFAAWRVPAGRVL